MANTDWNILLFYSHYQNEGQNNVHGAYLVINEYFLHVLLITELHHNITHTSLAKFNRNILIKNDINFVSDNWLFFTNFILLIDYSSLNNQTSLYLFFERSKWPLGFNLLSNISFLWISFCFWICACRSTAKSISFTICTIFSYNLKPNELLTTTLK